MAQRAGGVESRLQKPGGVIGNAERPDHLVAHELVEHPAAVDNRISRFRIERGRALSHDLAVGRVSDATAERAKIGEQHADIGK